jgi:hypothetical protein
LITLEQSLYVAFSVMLLVIVVFMMSNYYSISYDLAQDIGMKDVLKTVNTASVKVYLESRYFGSEGTVVYLKLPSKIAGEKYTLYYNSSSDEFCFLLPKTYCEHSYLFASNVPIIASLDSSEELHQVSYVNNSIVVS